MSHIKSVEQMNAAVLDNPQDVVSYFPHTAFRDHQQRVLKEIHDAFYVDDIPYVIFEGPTGFGKTPVAITLGLHSQDSFLLTSQKTLQDQYHDDYESFGLRIIKGRNAYPCVVRGKDFTCADCLESEAKSCRISGICPYLNAKSAAANSPVAGLNYAYFFNVTKCDPRRVFRKRRLLICDECHSVEKLLMSHVEFSISQYTFTHNLQMKVNIPKFKTLNEYSVWLKEIQDLIESKISSLENDINRLNSIPLNQFKVDDLIELQSKKEIFDDLDRVYRKISRFLSTYNLTEWVFYTEIIEKQFKSHTRKFEKIVFKPVSIDLYTQEHILEYGEKILFMSATVLDYNAFCESLGLPIDKCRFIRAPSIFDPNRRKVYFTNTGKMNKRNIDSLLPKIVDDVKTTINFHKNEKGIIHTHTYKIANYIRNNFHDPRLLFHDGKTRNEVIERHINSSEPTIIVSPSMTEGLDLAGDLGRFAMIVKLPFLYLGDKQIARKRELNPGWYNYQTCLTLIQAMGRVMRSEDDYCTIYIMDSLFHWFYNSNRQFFPKYVTDSFQL